MNSSTMSLAGHLDWHPVHRATALLRQALLNSASPAPDPAEIWSDHMFRLAPAPVDLADGPVNIAHPISLAELFGLASMDDESAICQRPVTLALDGSAATAALEDASGGDAMLDGTTQIQLQNLVEAFYRRQRQASLLVACSVAVAFLLTFGGLVLLFSLTDSGPAGRDGTAPKDGTSVSGRADFAPAQMPDKVRVKANRSAKSAPLLVPVGADAVPAPVEASARQQVILATPKRPLALAPLLPLGSARYLLLRGLPEEVALSAGRRTGSGTWMIKAADMPGLTLTLGTNASGDYPLEAYLLDAGSGPQARRNLVLRVDTAPQIYTAGLGLSWPTAIWGSDTKPSSPADTSTTAAPPMAPEALHARAQTLLSEGDVAQARRLLTDLAERGHADAAYELALTYDREVLAKAGIDGVDGDEGIARAWYEHAAQAGHAGAAQRLEMLAKPRGGA